MKIKINTGDIVYIDTINTTNIKWSKYYVVIMVGDSLLTCLSLRKMCTLFKDNLNNTNSILPDFHYININTVNIKKIGYINNEIITNIINLYKYNGDH